MMQTEVHKVPFLLPTKKTPGHNLIMVEKKINSNPVLDYLYDQNAILTLETHKYLVTECFYGAHNFQIGTTEHISSSAV